MQIYRHVVLILLFSLFTFASSKSVAVAWNYANAPGTYGDIEFTTSGTLPAGTYTFNNLTINSGVTVTLTGNTSTTEGSGVVIFAASVNHLGTINGNAKGFPSQSGPGAGLSGSSTSGGGHGGTGSWYVSSVGFAPGKAYGSATAPTALGSGGGRGGTAGGAGGGAIKIVATGNINIGGAINVNGTAGVTAWDSGGSGGSIWIEADNITGAGAVTATGGNGGGGPSVGGSGGRIYLAYQTSRTHSGTINVAGGTGAQPGSGVVVKTTAPTSLTIPVSSTLSNGTYAYNDVTIPSGVTVSVTGIGYVNNDGPGKGTGTSGAGYGGVGAGSQPGATYGDAMAPTDYGSGGSGTSGPGGWGGGALKFVVSGTMTVSGTLAANGSAAAGDSWAGAGSGGSIWIDAGTWAGGSSGAITANGGAMGGAASGAGGGRILIEYSTKSYTGTAPVASKSSGSSAVNGTVILKDKSGGAMDCGSSTVTLDSSSYAAGESIVVSSACSIIVNGDLFPASVSVAGSGAKLTVNGNLLVTSTIDISSGGALVMGSNKLVGVGYIVSAASVTIGSGSSFNADGMGYDNGLGQGAGGIGNSTGGGGGYGGAGGAGAAGAGGSTYGWAVKPIHIGSSGGNSTTGLPAEMIGAAGGGAVILVVPGTLQINGTLSANGVNCTSKAGPGSGGTVNITAGTVQGSGYIRANGGIGSTGMGGAGGGRVYISANTWSFTNANVTVTGGTGRVAGGAGSFPGVVTSTTATALDFVEPLQNSIRKNSVFDPIPIIVGKDGSGNVDRNFSSTVNFSAFSDAACTIAASGTLTNSNADNPLQFAPINGVGIFPGVFYNTSHTIYVQGSAGALKTPCEELIVGGAVATQLFFTTQPADLTQANIVMARQPVVEARDADGVVDTLANTSALGVYSDATCSTYVGALTAGTGNNTGGVTTFSNVRYTNAGTFYLKATSTNSGITAEGCSQIFEITPGTATKLGFNTSPGNTVAGVVFATQPVVEVRDTWDNLISTATNSISFVVVATSGSCTSATTVAGTFTGEGPYTAVGGQVTGTGMSFTKAQAIRLRASASGLTSACSSNFTISAAALDSMVWNVPPPATGKVNVNFASPSITIGGLDQYGNTKALTSGVTLGAYTDSSCTSSIAGLSASGGLSGGNQVYTTATYNKTGTIYLKGALSGAETPCSAAIVFTATANPFFFRGY